MCLRESASPRISFFFFFNDTATTEIYTLSLHDALPICAVVARGRREVHHPLPERTGRRRRRALAARRDEQWERAREKTGGDREVRGARAVARDDRADAERADQPARAHGDAQHGHARHER